MGAPARAQNADSLLILLDASDWETRATAIAQLNKLPMSELPGGYAEKAIALLEREAVNPDPEATGPGEGYGQYEIKLMRGVLRLQDPRSLRALALNGVEMSREAKHFVASHGGRAIPHLRDAWDSTEANRYAVVQTWGLMLSDYRNRLTDDEATSIRRSLVSAAPEEPLGFIRAANRIGLLTALPFVQAYADTVQSSLAQQRASAAADRLGSRRQRAGTAELANQFSLTVEAVCSDPDPGPERGACRSLENRLSTARRHIEGGRGKDGSNVLRSFIDKVEQAHGQGAFTDAERTLLVGNAEALIERL